MEKRGAKPKNSVNLVWRSELAYAIGLLVTDGNLSSDGRHIAFVSKDIEQIKNFVKCLGIQPKIGKTTSGYSGSSTPRVQFSDVTFYNFLLSLGIMPAKSKILSIIKIPPDYFWDYVRGAFDGDGSFHSYWDTRWRSSHMFYLIFASASPRYVDWLQGEIYKRLHFSGHITKSKKSSVYQLKYAKRDALEIIKKMYYTRRVVCLSRKRVKIEKVMAIEKKQQKLYS